MSLVILNLKLKELYELYEKDEFLLQKINHYINIELPNILINTKKLYQDRINRKLLLTEAHNEFVNNFINLHKNIYFYCSTTEIFFKYNNINYNTIKEDDIIHDILSTISQQTNITNEKNNLEQLLIPWKYKIKTSIIKQIKDNSLFISLPESDTIQNIINLFYPIIFNTKNEVKYFLTILGDNILKKSNNNIYLIQSTIKPILRILENFGGKYFGHIPLQNSFRYKYHDHNYDDCRLMCVKNFIFNEEMSDLFSKNILDVFVICCYYSKRFNNSDEFLLKHSDNILNNYALFLKNNSGTAIIKIFIDSKIEKSLDSVISMKNILYLWKCFLDERSIPNIIFSTNLKRLLRENLDFNENDDTFSGYTSPCIPFVSNFIKFWDQCIVEDVNEYYLEIEEICILLKNWLGKSSGPLTEDNVLNLIKHFYPDIIIENNKYVLSINCNLWNKKKEIMDFLNILKWDCKSISIYDLYCHYTEHNKKNSKKINLPLLTKNILIYLSMSI